MSVTSPPPVVRWDLTQFFRGIDDPRIDEAWEDLNRRADRFSETYRGKLASGDPEVVGKAIREIEALLQDAAKPGLFAELLFAADASDPKLGAFLQAQREKGTELQVKLLFFELELQLVPSDKLEAMAELPNLGPYRHYLQQVQAYRPHRLTEPEEIILEETANTGVRAWVRLFEEITANHKYAYRDPISSEEKELSQEEVLTLLRDADRDVRAAAAHCFTRGLQQLQRVIVFTYNNLLQDKAVGDRLRKHPYPEHSRHLANELSQDVVDLVVGLCKDHYGMVSRFYNVKREILGLPELTHIDRYAPLHETQRTVSFDEGKAIVLESFAEFSDELSRRAEEFFAGRWIDAEPRPGKTGGAFCSFNTPDTHPVVMMSYLNKLDDVMTLAHELGHGVHASLSRKQSYFNFHGTLPMAELASIFGEMLVFERLVEESEPADRLALYAQKIEGVFATVFRQAAMYRFEQRCHETRRESGELTPEEFGEMWHEELQAMFGDSLTLGEEHKVWWSYVGHFFFAPFYVYAYSFGELLTLSLYQLAKREGPGFASKYLALLELGGSRSPKELMETVGVDLSSREFWLGGFSAMEELVEEFERLWNERTS